MTRGVKVEGCAVEGCDGMHAARGWCSKHYTRWLRHGDPLASLHGGSTSYWSVHQRIKAARGAAREHRCAEYGCDRQATDWAWLHRGPSAWAMNGRGCRIPYGTDPRDYVALCRSHHGRMDRHYARRRRGMTLVPPTSEPLETLW